MDRKGNLCPLDNRMLSFEVSGAGVYRAAANGDATDTNMFHLPQMPLFNGELMVLVQTLENAGEIELTVSGKGVRSGKIKLLSHK